MLRFVVRRLLLLVPILLGLSILVFLWIRALPGGPAQALLGERATPETVARSSEQYGLNEPDLRAVPGATSKTTSQGDFGSSSSRPGGRSSRSSSERLPATIELALAAMLFAIVVGMPLGFIAAKRYGGWLDHVSLVGVAARRSRSRSSSSRCSSSTSSP